jgi:hypothetical protein
VPSRPARTRSLSRAPAAPWNGITCVWKLDDGTQVVEKDAGQSRRTDQRSCERGPSAHLCTQLRVRRHKPARCHGGRSEAVQRKSPPPEAVQRKSPPPIPLSPRDVRKLVAGIVEGLREDAPVSTGAISSGNSANIGSSSQVFRPSSHRDGVHRLGTQPVRPLVSYGNCRHAES